MKEQPCHAVVMRFCCVQCLSRKKIYSILPFKLLLILFLNVFTVSCHSTGGILARLVSHGFMVPHRWQAARHGFPSAITREATFKFICFVSFSCNNCELL